MLARARALRNLATGRANSSARVPRSTRARNTPANKSALGTTRPRQIHPPLGLFSPWRLLQRLRKRLIGRYVFGNCDPWVFGHCEEVRRGSHVAAEVERANADHAYRVAEIRMMAPQNRRTARTSRASLCVWVAGRRYEQVGRPRSDLLDMPRFDHHVERERASRAALAHPAMAAVHDDRFGCEPIPNMPAIAAALHQRLSLSPLPERT